MFWEYSPNPANIASDLLRAKRALLYEEEIQIDDGVDTSLASEGVDPIC